MFVLERNTTMDNITELIEPIIHHAGHPTAYGKPIKRKILTIGREYYWKGYHLDDATLLGRIRTALEIPDEYNSLLINVYEAGDTIAWHTDRTTGLRPGCDVISVSVGGTGTLGYMHFKQDKTKIELTHGTCIRFDPFEHARRGEQHRARSVATRWNLTFRALL